MHGRPVPRPARPLAMPAPPHPEHDTPDAPRAAASGHAWQVVHWHAGAPSQPAPGAPCNGCGLCCLAEPCPLGMLVSRRRQGACAALRWSDAQQRYLCGMLADPGDVTGWRRPWAVRWMRALAGRWIAAGVGCDAAPLLAQVPAPARRDDSA